VLSSRQQYFVVIKSQNSKKRLKYSSFEAGTVAAKGQVDEEEMLQ